LVLPVAGTHSSHMTSVENRAAFRDVLREPVFRVVFCVRSLAIGADALRIVALSVLVYTTTGSAILAAVAFGIGFLPQLAGGTLLGALPDLVPPRRLLVLGYSAECAGATALALIDFPVWASLTIVAGIAMLTPAFQGSTGRVISEVLTGDAYVLGRSLLNMASAAAQLAGMAGGGIAVASLGPRHALLVTAACHLLAVVLTRLLLPDLPAPPRTGEALLRRSWRGNRRLLADPSVRVLLLAQWLPPAFVTGAESVLVPYAAVRGYPAGSAGLLLACVPVGMILGDLVVARLLSPAMRERLVIPLIALLGVPLLGFMFDIHPVPAGVLLFLLGCGFAYGLGIQRRFIEVIPDDARGQAFALMSTGLMTLQGVGPIALGAVAEVIPVGLAMGAAGMAILAIVCWLSARGYARA
jgi:predicted MFS family arabinose efflux permease